MGGVKSCSDEAAVRGGEGECGVEARVGDERLGLCACVRRLRVWSRSRAAGVSSLRVQLGVQPPQQH